MRTWFEVLHTVGPKLRCSELPITQRIDSYWIRKEQTIYTHPGSWDIAADMLWSKSEAEKGQTLCSSLPRATRLEVADIVLPRTVRCDEKVKWSGMCDRCVSFSSWECSMFFTNWNIPFSSLDAGCVSKAVVTVLTKETASSLKSL